MKRHYVSVVVPAYNAVKTIEKCLETLIDQTYKKTEYEIIVVDDGSKDETKKIILKYKNIRYIYQVNAGPASARNKGWKNAKGDIIVFTDSDCVPERDWLEEMIKPFKNNENIAAVGGAYDKTINNSNRLACLIGEEIKFRYSKMGEYTEAHGSYSLGVRKNVLEKIGGFNEAYPIATAEDWDLCYKIIENDYKIYFNKNAKVGHHHPQSLMKYLRTQYFHGFYRMLLYSDHKKMVKGDDYSGSAKWIVILSGISLLLFALIWVSSLARLFLILVMIGIIGFQMELINYISKRYSIKSAIEVLIIQIIRGYYWFFGMIMGGLKYKYFPIKF